ncbi:mannose-1-phosphate guanylyltransferase (GDP); mannose-6-phosphate isomerase, type 2 [Desulfobulbus propionicus DSM 2032]|uniref:mannose-1-phosphate guanylyltransferase n=1 Tax=Desulfobulbus propionicus (strain ATCC 33891 / DSM 2032 / VKM B-1956 / 1pr3) TaxID=577650 RepID=A0A7U4DN61_DESPD|nr:mannose-1-phosphate guanylyltransferase/mannose-6-phosphate isomerase [Desulfobulbus propionicus]ADW16721.1 mannose-1-phosphate guanylyltransferase (GDP); mannose-6-phosphate isomerase, type 2 [Desulfobulbus propionicus DSM 2032]
MLIPLILSGGAGTRLWPVSRQGHPKPFMQLTDGQSLLLKTYLRAAAVAQGGQILTATNRDYFFMSKDELTKARVGDVECRNTFLLEPFGRNTAAAIIMSAFMVAEQFDRDACLLVLPADHLVQRQEAFAEAVQNAEILARQGRLVTFGIVPSMPETGFGYIEAGPNIPPGRSVLRFVEKPDVETAQKYVSSGNFYWNSGMFCFLAGTVLNEFALHAPDIFQTAQACWQELRHTTKADANMLEIPAKHFEQFPDISVDYALLERSANIAVLPADIGWSDIGSWSAVSQLIKADADNNRGIGECLFVDSHNIFAQSEERLIATVGVDDLIIVDTADALLIVPPDKAQDVKKVVTLLKKQNHDAYKLHRTVFRPWGSYTVLEEGPRFKIKRIEVKPGASLSLQMHHHRSEHWIVVNGMAKVTNGDQELLVGANESTYIPAGCSHRLENPGILNLVMIEVQSGEYLGEDDIVRLSDKYGRCQ